MMLVAAITVAATVSTPAMAQPGQCSVTGYGPFACDLVVDGGGFSFALPNGDTLVFTPVDLELGLVFLIPDDAKPGQRPRELGEFAAVPNEPGCWIDEDDYQFCALVFKEENT